MKAAKKKTTTAAEANYRKRSDAVAAVRGGERIEAVARTFGIGRATLFRWLARYRSGGESDLRDESRPGRPRKIDDELMKQLYDAVTRSDPRQYAFSCCLWTLGIIRSLINQQWGIELSKSGASRLMTHLGLTPQQAIYRSYKRDQNKIDSYLKRRLPQIRRLARARGAAIYFVHEASVKADTHRGTTQGKIGRTAVVESCGSCINLIGAVNPRGDMRFRAFEGSMNQGKLLEFLADLMHDTGKPIIAIIDNAGYHIGGFAKRSNRIVTLFYLPPHSPEFNPDEQVCVESKMHLLDEVRNVLKWTRQRRDFMPYFFHLKDTKYAADAY
jgi:transposase